MAAPKKKKQYRALRALSYKGERVETGAVLELTSDDLLNINTDYIELVDKREEKQKEQQKEPSASDAEGSEIEI